MFWRFSRSLFAPWFIIYWYHTGENATQVILSLVKGAGFSHSLYLVGRVPSSSPDGLVTLHRKCLNTHAKKFRHTSQSLLSLLTMGRTLSLNDNGEVDLYTVRFPTSPILRWYTKSDTVSERTRKRTWRTVTVHVHMEGSEKIPDVSSTASESRKVSLNWILFNQFQVWKKYRISREIKLLLRKMYLCCQILRFFLFLIFLELETCYGKEKKSENKC